MPIRSRSSKTSLKKFLTRQHLLALIFALAGIVILFIAATNPTRLFSFAKETGSDILQCEKSCATIWIPDLSHQTTSDKEEYIQCRGGCIANRDRITAKNKQCPIGYLWWPYTNSCERETSHPVVKTIKKAIGTAPTPIQQKKLDKAKSATKTILKSGGGQRR